MTLSTPCTVSRRASSSPAGPAPMMPTCVRSALCENRRFRPKADLTRVITDSLRRQLGLAGAHRTDNCADRVDDELRLILVDLVAAVGVGDVRRPRHAPCSLGLP